MGSSSISSTLLLNCVLFLDVSDIDHFYATIFYNSLLEVLICLFCCVFLLSVCSSILKV